VNTQDSAYVTVARIVRTRGVRGEVAAEILTDFPDRLKTLATCFLWDGLSVPRQSRIRNCWISLSRGGQAIFHFEGSNSIPDAEKLVGLEVQIPFADRMQLPSSSYYVTDLVGCEVFEQNGVAIGSVTEVQFAGEEGIGTPILVVGSPTGELLIPLAQEICLRIDTTERRIEVALPEGLREINQ
jgi:16S rRNA processing protein RimM